MFEKFLKFFIDNARLNYLLFFLVFAIGIWSYQKMPKEVFPSFEMDSISITGKYTGSSVEVMDKMAVVELEKELKTLEGLKEMTSVITSGSFRIILEFQKGINRYETLNKVKDAISISTPNLPSDMTEPKANLVVRNRDLIDISIISDTLNTDQMKPIAQKIEQDLYNIKGISQIDIFGESEKYYEIKINEDSLLAYGINPSDFFNTIKTISYIFPIGKIEDSNKQFYVSTSNGPKTETELKNTIIKVSNKVVKIKDIASIKEKYEDSSTLYSFMGKNSISLKIKQQDTANALEIAKEVKQKVNKFNQIQNEVFLEISDDNSKRVLNRLNIVSSNITLGVILIAILVMLLINRRMSAVITIGIPTSFVIAAIYMYFTGYSINMITLVGVLIAIGIVVDDAIVVSENIQQHIEKGEDPKTAAINGSKEVFKPVTIASLTTLFSFLPILMISGTMGEIMKLIPIAVSSLIVASLIESFIFLPIHASHILNNKSKVTSWEIPNKIYNKIIHFNIKYRKTFIVTFLILVPLLTYVSMTNTKFQMFPKFDSTDVKISIKGNPDNLLGKSYEIVKHIENDLLKNQKQLSIKNVSSIAGYRRDAGSNTETGSSVMYMTVELQDLKPQTFVDKYITSNLALYQAGFDGERDKSSSQIAKMLNEYIKQNNLKQKYDLEEIIVIQRRVGPVKSDIKVGLVSKDQDLIKKSIEQIENKMKTINGVTTVQNTIKYGIDEIKLKINDYGKSLGISESQIGSYLSDIYLIKEKTKVTTTVEMIDVKVQSVNKNEYKKLKNIKIPYSNSYVKLGDICDISITKSFQSLTKDKGLVNFYIYANVDPKIVTATEVTNLLQPTYEQLKKKGIKLVFKGEEEKKKELKSDMLLATGLALVLILFSMLYLFNSFKESFLVMSVIPFSLLGVFVGHFVMGMNLSMPSIVGALGLAGVVVNDGIIMLTYLKKSKNLEEMMLKATKRFRPIIITTVTTIIGFSTLIFFPSGESVIFQPIAVSLGFGLLWGTVLNLIYLPVMYSFIKKFKKETV